MPSEYDISQAAASIYAESLLSLANEAGQAEAVGGELRALADLWDREPSFAAMMSSMAIDDDARRESIRKIFGGRVSKLVLNLLMVLNDRMRGMVLPGVCGAYLQKLSRQLGQAEVHVTSAVPLDETQRQDLAARLKKLTAKDPILIEAVDPELLGGVCVQVADRVYDLSVRRRLRELTSALAGASEKHLLHNMKRFVTQG